MLRQSVESDKAFHRAISQGVAGRNCVLFTSLRSRPSPKWQRQSKSSYFNLSSQCRYSGRYLVHLDMVRFTCGRKGFLSKRCQNPKVLVANSIKVRMSRIVEGGPLNHPSCREFATSSRHINESI